MVVSFGCKIITASMMGITVMTQPPTKTTLNTKLRKLARQQVTCGSKKTATVITTEITVMTQPLTKTTTSTKLRKLAKQQATCGWKTIMMILPLQKKHFQWLTQITTANFPGTSSGQLGILKRTMMIMGTMTMATMTMATMTTENTVLLKKQWMIT